MKNKHTRFLWAIVMLCCMVFTACHTDRPDNYLEENLKASLTQDMVGIGLTEEQAENVLTVYHELGGDSALLDDFAYDEENRILTAEYDTFYTLQFVFDEEGILNDITCRASHIYTFYENKVVVEPFAKYLASRETREKIVALVEETVFADMPDLSNVQMSPESTVDWHIDIMPATGFVSETMPDPDAMYFASAYLEYTFEDGTVENAWTYAIVFTKGDEWELVSLTFMDAPGGFYEQPHDEVLV